MAIYHLCMKQFSRVTGRSATGAAAYRAGVVIVDQRTGLIHDYTRKGGVLFSRLILPGGSTTDRAEFWNAVERHHKRGDAVVAREIEVSLPYELDAAAREALAIGYARELADRYGVAVDVALHAPSQSGDDRNWHAHILLSACAVGHDGTLGKKVIELDPIACRRQGPRRSATEPPAERERPRWEALVNHALVLAGSSARVDHRSHEARGIEAVPETHLGPSATQRERSGHRTVLGDVNRSRRARNDRLREERLGLAKLHAELDEAISSARQPRQRRSVRRPGRFNEQRPQAGRDNGPAGPNNRG